MFSLLGHFHAGSYYLFQEYQYDFSKFLRNSFDFPETIDMFYLLPLKAFRQVLDSWEDRHKYIDKIDYLIENCVSKGSESYRGTGRTKSYNVLRHGDFHTANMLRSPRQIYLVSSMNNKISLIFITTNILD